MLANRFVTPQGASLAAKNIVSDRYFSKIGSCFVALGHLVPIVLLASVAAGAVPKNALAAPLLESNLGGAVFVGPTSAHATSVFWNPAATAQMSDSELFLSAQGTVASTTIQRKAISNADGEPTEELEDPVGTVVVSPGAFLGLVFPLRQFRLGFAAYTPFAEQLPANRPELTYHTNGGYFYAEYITLTLGIPLPPDVAIGFGLTGVFTEVDLRFSRDPLLEACSARPCAVETTSERYRFTSTDDWSPVMSINLGIMARYPKLPNLWFGAAYVGQPNFKSISRSGKLEGFDALDTRLTFRLPQMVHFGARYRFKSLDLVLGLRWIDFSVHDGYDLRLSGPDVEENALPEWIVRYRGFEDVLSVDLGSELRVSDRLRVAFRLGYESSAVPTNAVAPEQVDAPKLNFGLGAELRATPHLRIAASYALSVFMPQDVDQSIFQPSTFIDCNDSGHELEACEGVRLGYSMPTAAGEYSRLENTIQIGVRYLF